MHTVSEPTQSNVLDKKILPHHVGMTLSDVVRELAPKKGQKFTSPALVFAACAWLTRRKQESILAFYLDAQSCLIARRAITKGTLNSAVAHPREVLYPAIRYRAASFILVHNHPSGNLSPSCEDIELTRALAKAADMVGIPLVDHVIVSRSGFTSLRDQGVI